MILVRCLLLLLVYSADDPKQPTSRPTTPTSLVSSEEQQDSSSQQEQQRVPFSRRNSLEQMGAAGGVYPSPWREYHPEQYLQEKQKLQQQCWQMFKKAREAYLQQRHSFQQRQQLTTYLSVYGWILRLLAGQKYEDKRIPLIEGWFHDYFLQCKQIFKEAFAEVRFKQQQQAEERAKTKQEQQELKKQRERLFKEYQQMQKLNKEHRLMKMKRSKEEDLKERQRQRQLAKNSLPQLQKQIREYQQKHKRSQNNESSSRNPNQTGRVDPHKRIRKLKTIYKKRLIDEQQQQKKDKKTKKKQQSVPSGQYGSRIKVLKDILFDSSSDSEQQPLELNQYKPQVIKLKQRPKQKAAQEEQMSQQEKKAMVERTRQMRLKFLSKRESQPIVPPSTTPPQASQPSSLPPIDHSRPTPPPTPPTPPTPPPTSLIPLPVSHVQERRPSSPGRGAGLIEQAVQQYYDPLQDGQDEQVQAMAFNYRGRRRGGRKMRFPKVQRP